ncbi:alkaline phosphatase [Candidatus Falkowbacteria bacterium RIFCSPHIGHO2_02_FULL_45_15]|uniref:Alkaline phosphatase n=1 Tax=Candidatus Falkowbacteria bacterium RIFCSPHIGHO2_02_FULL_45_15 TaxID=1797987 RepID=A0A1F5RKH3_9BACT|nr:MAG: alkaline phosphatase [Candidatus Falkowbacteria bacterium RIFCSPHIGHO2_02_FULL_45_15]
MIAPIINWLVNIVVSAVNFTGYAGIFLLMLAESCGVPAPSEVIMPFAGFLVAQGKLGFWAVVIAGSLGNLAGSLLAYYIGWKGGRPLLEKYGKYVLISRHDLDLAERWFTNYGPAAVFSGRLLPVVRTYISFPAGVARMDIKKFSLYTFAGALLWSILFTWLGVKMGDNWGLIRVKLEEFDLAIAVLIAIAVGLYVWRHLKRRHHDVI